MGQAKRGRPGKQSDVKPVSAFNKNIREAAKTAFDRETGKPVPASSLMTYAEALAQYHLRPEAKFLNGDFCDRGRTERRHVFATRIVHIGKEANKWEEQYFLGEDEEAEIEYGTSDGATRLDAAIRDLCDKVGERAAAERTRISRTALRRALKGGSPKCRGQFGRDLLTASDNQIQSEPDQPCSLAWYQPNCTRQEAILAPPRI